MGLLRSRRGNGGGGEGGDPPATTAASVTDEEVMKFVEEFEEEAGVVGAKGGGGGGKKKRGRGFLSSMRRKKDRDAVGTGTSSAGGGGGLETVTGEEMWADVRDDGDVGGGETSPQTQPQPQDSASNSAAPADEGADADADEQPGQPQPSASSSTPSVGRNPSFALRSLVQKLTSRGTSENEGEGINASGTSENSSSSEKVVPKEVRFDGPISAVRGSPQRTRRIEQPSARESAFSGAARYDWIDIETAAACKVQAAYRRAKTCEELEKNDMTTSFMRNRRRERKYRKKLPDHAASEDVPAILQMCGIGLLFGDAVEEDTYENREAARLAEHREMRKEEAMRDFELRESGMKRSAKLKSSRVEEMVDDL